MRLTRKRSRIPALGKLSRHVSSFLQRSSSHSIKITNEKESDPLMGKMVVKREISLEYSRHAIEVEKKIEAGAVEHLVIQTYMYHKHKHFCQGIIFVGKQYP